MSDKETKNKSAKEARDERLKAQLRANLQRRKGQKRVRKASASLESAAQEKD